jgi:hypothetical protein
MPAEDTPWEAIADFRRDEEARRAYLALKVWIHRLAHDDRPLSHVREELEHTLAE